MEKLSNGNTILAYEETTAHSENDVDVIHIRFSDDNGATWTAEDTDLNGDPVSVGLPTGASTTDAYGPGGTYTWQAPNDDIYLHCWNVDYSTQSMQGSWRTKSTDGGLTWGAWEQLSVTDFTEAENTKMAFEEAHFIYGTDVYAVVRVYDTLFSTVKAVFIKSTDNGATWTKVSDISAYTDKTHEMAMEYLGNNNILIIARDANNAKTYHITSDDFGATWSDIVQIQTSIDVVGRNRMFTDSHIKGEASWWTDNKVIMIGFVLTNPGSSQGRRNAVWLSNDKGQSWTGPIYIDESVEDAGYGDLIYDSNTDTYRIVTYKGYLDKANLIQYNFSIDWDAPATTFPQFGVFILERV